MNRSFIVEICNNSTASHYLSRLRQGQFKPRKNSIIIITLSTYNQLQHFMSAQKQNNLHSSLSDCEPHSHYSQVSEQQASHQQSNPCEAEFQKNYPKNIFIPLIEYLTQLGYQQAYEKCVGYRTDFQGKNVVSLNSIYTLMTQDWFNRNINKEAALVHISNKILINSKIKKKLFHLLISHLILKRQYVDIRQFKRRISKEANFISRKQLPHDELFSYPNSIIYLLHVFRKILLLCGHKKSFNKLSIEEEFAKLSLEEEPSAEPKAKNIGSKEQYKFYVKEIVHIFSAKGLCIQNYNDLLEQIRQVVMEKDKQIREKYQLVEGVPSWGHFIEVVVMRCLENKRKDVKITNHLLNQWINECKNKMVSIQTDKITKIDHQNDKSWDLDWLYKKINFNHENWSPVPPVSLVQHHDDVQISQQMQPQVQKSTQGGKNKQFRPIILSILAPQ